MWTVVYMAQSKEIAEKVEEILTNEGILTKQRPVNRNNSKEDDYYEILVPESEVEEAHTVIIEQRF